MEYTECNLLLKASWSNYNKARQLTAGHCTPLIWRSKSTATNPDEHVT